MAGVELRVEPRRILKHERFNPSLRRGSIERMSRLAGEPAAMEIEPAHQSVERGLGWRGASFARIPETKQDAIARPAAKLEAAKTDGDFARSRHESKPDVVADGRHMQ